MILGYKLMTKFTIILRSQLCCLTTIIQNVYRLAKNKVSKQNILYLYFLFLIKKL